MEMKENVFPSLPERLTELGELAMNLWWSWHPAVAEAIYGILEKA